MKIEVVKIRGEWKVEFSFDNQFFTLEYGGTKLEAEWSAKMLRRCFACYKRSVRKVSTKPKTKEKDI